MGKIVFKSTFFPKEEIVVDVRRFLQKFKDDAGIYIYNNFLLHSVIRITTIEEEIDLSYGHYPEGWTFTKNQNFLKYNIVNSECIVNGDLFIKIKNLVKL